MNSQDCTCVEEVLVVANPIATEVIDEDGDSRVIPLDDVFNLEDVEVELVPIPTAVEPVLDADGNPLLEPVLDADGNPVTEPVLEPVLGVPVEPVVEAEIVDGQIVIDPISDRNGVQEFEVVGTTEDGQEIRDNFAVVVNPVDDPLSLKQELPDIDFVANQNLIRIKVDDFFQDPDSAEVEISLAIKTNTNSELIAARIEEGYLIIESDLTAPGEADITIEATSGDETIADTFNVSVDENICIKDGEPLAIVDVSSFESTRGNLYTADIKEIDFLNNNQNDDWQPGAGYRSFTGAGEGLVGISRFYDTQADTHFYTSNQTEISFINENIARFSNEGIAHYSYSSGEINSESIPMYRFYDQGSDNHLFTLDQSEGNDLTSEGIAYYVLPELV